MGDLQSAKIYLQLPLNSNRPSSDVDFGDETTAAADTSNISGNQPRSSAVFEIKCPSQWTGDCWAKRRYCEKSVCSKSKTAKVRQFTTCEQMDSFRHSLPTGFKWTYLTQCWRL